MTNEWRPPPEQEPPLLRGPAVLTEGYYELEALERGFALQAMRYHREPVAIWYRALTLFREGMIGTWEYPGDDGPGVGMAMWGLQSQLLGLGVSSAKAALDMLLAGYYSVAYGAIRHMLESFVQCLYVTVKPEEVRRWYQDPEGTDADHRSPGMKIMVDAIKALPAWADAAWMFDKVYDAWSLMSKGSHPTGAGITQTVDEAASRHVIGATYNRDLARTGFDHGLFAVLCLIQALSWTRHQDPTWNGRLAALWQDARTWREEMIAMVGAEAAQAL